MSRYTFVCLRLSDKVFRNSLMILNATIFLIQASNARIRLRNAARVRYNIRRYIERERRVINFNANYRRKLNMKNGSVRAQSDIYTRLRKVCTLSMRAGINNITFFRNSFVRELHEFPRE